MFLRQVKEWWPDLVTVERAYLWETLAFAYDKRGHLARAITCFKLQALFQPLLTDAYLNLGAMLAHRGYHASALSAYAQGLQIDPLCEYLNYNLAQLQSTMGDHAAAQQALNVAITANDERGINYQLQGHWCLAAKNYRGAIDAYRKALERFPEHQRSFRLEALLCLAGALEHMGWHYSAIEALFDALDYKPRDPEILYDIARIMGRQTDDWESAEAVIDYGVKWNPRYSPLWRLAAQMHYVRGDEVRARYCQRQAARVSKKHGPQKKRRKRK